MVTRWTRGPIAAGLRCGLFSRRRSRELQTPALSRLREVTPWTRSTTHCKPASRPAPRILVPVIVTLTGAIDEDQLTACGLDIAHRFEEIGAVSGAIAAGEVRRLAALPEVKTVELDSEMRAMDR